MENFITTLAWIFGIGSTVLIVLRIICAACYSDLEKLQDQLRGIKKTYPIGKPLMVAIVCWGWIFSM